jgi:septal ring factor EnvC (AmiA/AmiB activator)
MTLLLTLLILATAVGGFCLWISGLMFGRRARDPGPDQAAYDELAASQAALRDEFARVRADLEHSQGRLTETESERGRLKGELDALRGEADQAEGELGQLREQLDLLRKKKRREEMLTPATPLQAVSAPDPDQPEAEGDADSALAELDLERVAHRETREELDKIKQELVALRAEGEESRPSVPPVPGRRGPRFQTVSIATRAAEVPGVEHDRLRLAYEQLQKDKEEIEAEYARTLEQLKLQNLQDDPAGSPP